MSDAPAQGIRARARAQLLADVGRVARSHLAERGAAALSVRAIARDLGLAPSALYRYYPSRDALLTRLIIESYDALGDAVESAEAEIDRADVAGRFLTIGRTLRAWARANPNEYALIYGSPVPGYSAPQDTVDPATRTSRVLIRLAADIEPSDALLRSPASRSPLLEQQFRTANEVAGVDADHDVLAIGVGAWSMLFGMVSFELFGTFTNAFEPADDLFETQLSLALVAFGLTPPTT